MFDCKLRHSTSESITDEEDTFKSFMTFEITDDFTFSLTISHRITTHFSPQRHKLKKGRRVKIYVYGLVIMTKE